MFDHTIKAFLDQIAASKSEPIYELSPQKARDILENLQQAHSVSLSPTVSKKIELASKEYGTFNIYIVKPILETKNKLPIILWMHGGGWVLGNYKTHERLITEIAHKTEAAIVFVEYTNAPEAQYPIIHEQGYTAALWIEKHAIDYNLDSSRVAIVGDSAGGLLATAIALMSKQRGGPKFIFQALLYPVTNSNFETQSYNELATGYWLEKKGMEWFWNSYVPNKKIRKDPLVSPLQAPLELLKGLPSTYIMTNEYDVLRDEGEAYAHKLLKAQVNVTAVRYIGLIHDSLMLNAITTSPIVRAAIDQLASLLKYHLT